MFSAQCWFNSTFKQLRNSELIGSLSVSSLMSFSNLFGVAA
jgi:hypothetical protein